MNSILNQTCQDFEVLILDNLSKDQTLPLINNYNSDKIQIYSAKDAGIYDAMNKGISLAKGKWLYFLGSDDYLINNKVLEDVSLELNETQSMVYGNTVLNGDGKTLIQRRNIYTIFLKNICHQAIFYNKQYLLNLKYNLDYPVLADWDLNIKLFKKHLFSQKTVNLSIASYSTLGVSNNWGDSQDFKSNFMFKKNMFNHYLGSFFGGLFYIVFRISVLLKMKANIE